MKIEFKCEKITQAAPTFFAAAFFKTAGSHCEFAYGQATYAIIFAKNLKLPDGILFVVILMKTKL
jgi:hypothetical protein